MSRYSDMLPRDCRSSSSRVIGRYQMLIGASRVGVEIVPSQGGRAAHAALYAHGAGRAEEAELLHSKRLERSRPMTDYQAPVRQMRFTIDHLADFAAVTALPDFSAVDG